MSTGSPTSRLALGTVQFGIPYGVNNANGIPSDKELEQIFDLAKASNIKIIDTASGYGNAEERLGAFVQDQFKVVTKFSGLCSSAEVKKQLEQSLMNLGLSSVYGYMAHKSESLINSPNIWKILRKSQDQGKVKKIGYSLYEASELKDLLSRGFKPDLVQVPFSILDRKFEPLFESLKSIGTEIHVRSVFLQGLYFINPVQLPVKLLDLKPVLEKLNSISASANTSIAGLALSYVLQNQFIDYVVIGVDTAAHLKKNIELSHSIVTDTAILNELQELSTNSPELLNPVNW